MRAGGAPEGEPGTWRAPPPRSPSSRPPGCRCHPALPRQVLGNWRPNWSGRGRAGEKGDGDTGAELGETGGGGVGVRVTKAGCGEEAERSWGLEFEGIWGWSGELRSLRPKRKAGGWSAGGGPPAPPPARGPGES